MAKKNSDFISSKIKNKNIWWILYFLPNVWFQLPCTKSWNFDVADNDHIIYVMKFYFDYGVLKRHKSNLFFQIIRHDLGSPLSHISNYLEK